MSSDVTIITVAHRLQTVMDADKIVSSMYSYLRFLVLSMHVDGTWWRSDRELSSKWNTLPSPTATFRLNLTVLRLFSKRRIVFWSHWWATVVIRMRYTQWQTMEWLVNRTLIDKENFVPSKSRHSSSILPRRVTMVKRKRISIFQCPCQWAYELTFE